MIPFDIEAFCQECRVAEPGVFIERCHQLYDILIAANKQFNLTRIETEEGFWTKHVADSLAIVKYYPELAVGRIHLADIGCGAGFPSLVLASAYPEMLITAIDSTGKKINFVRSAAEMLGLKNLRAIHGRAVELNRMTEWKGRFEVITARAVAPAPKIYHESCNMLNGRRGRYILYKTPEHAAADLPLMKELTAESGMEWDLSPEFELPDNAGKRQFLASSLASLDLK